MEGTAGRKNKRDTKMEKKVNMNMGVSAIKLSLAFLISICHFSRIFGDR